VTGGDDTSEVSSADTVLDTTSDTAVDAPTDTAAPAVTTPVVTAPGATLTGDTKCPAVDGSQARVTKFEKAPPMCIDAAKKYTATFDTTEGSIVVDLDTAKTPQTVNNFVTLSRYKYYDGTVIFRTDTSIDIIQGGGLTNTDDPGYTIADEGSGYKYVEGDLAMARTGEPNSAGGQWFFVAGPKASALDGQGTYVNFAKVTSGLDVVKNILALSSGSGALGGVPSRNVVINSVTITES
jgi:cyclophilin family peptidyl-prolyl cis-trans isomerase